MTHEVDRTAFAPQLEQWLWFEKDPDEDFFLVSPHCGHTQIW